MPYNKRFVVKALVPPREKDEKSYWTAIGSAWVNPADGDRPESIAIRLNAFPATTELRAYPADDFKSDSEQAA